LSDMFILSISCFCSSGIVWGLLPLQAIRIRI